MSYRSEHAQISKNFEGHGDVEMRYLKTSYPILVPIQFELLRRAWDKRLLCAIEPYMNIIDVR